MQISTKTLTYEHIHPHTRMHTHSPTHAQTLPHTLTLNKRCDIESVIINLSSAQTCDVVPT